MTGLPIWLIWFSVRLSSHSLLCKYILFHFSLRDCQMFGILISFFLEVWALGCVYQVWFYSISAINFLFWKLLPSSSFLFLILLPGLNAFIYFHFFLFNNKSFYGYKSLFEHSLILFHCGHSIWPAQLLPPEIQWRFICGLMHNQFL